MAAASVIKLPKGGAKMQGLAVSQADTAGHWLDRQPASTFSATVRNTRMNSPPLPQSSHASKPILRLREKTGAEPLAATIGRNVRRLREESEWTLEQLAALAGIGHEALQHIEAARREPSIGELWKVSVILQVPCGSLLQPGETDILPGLSNRH